MRTPQDILKTARTIAVVGASDDPAKPSHKVPVALRGRGYRILPVNPNDPEVLGVPSVPSVADLPDGVDGEEGVVHVGEQVSVAVHSHDDGRVAEALLDRLHRDACGDE